eukprot:scaffold627_cov144-Skeletonema_menzelii.AAC.11
MIFLLTLKASLLASASLPLTKWEGVERASRAPAECRAPRRRSSIVKESQNPKSKAKYVSRERGEPDRCPSNSERTILAVSRAAFAEVQTHHLEAPVASRSAEGRAEKPAGTSTIVAVASCVRVVFEIN